MPRLAVAKAVEARGAASLEASPAEKVAVVKVAVVKVAVKVAVKPLWEAAMSSPITPLNQTWNGVLGGLAISARYDAATQSVHATVRNTLSQKLCYVANRTSPEVGDADGRGAGTRQAGRPEPRTEAASSLAVASEPKLAGVSYDGYVIHMEVFDCAGPGPVPHTGGEGAEGSGGEGSESGGESGSESGGSGGEEGSGATLGLNETFDIVRGGARLILSYDAASNSFKGTVENTTNNVLTRVRIEVHLSNGTELVRRRRWIWRRARC